MEESTVFYEYDENLHVTVNWRTAGAHRKRRYVSIACYIFLSHHYDGSSWFGQTDSKHSLTGIQDWLGSICYIVPIWSLHPYMYGAAVPSCRIQYSSRFQRKGVPRLGLFVGLYVFSKIRTFIERMKWSDILKCLWSKWLPPWLIWNRCQFILLLNWPFVFLTYINLQILHSIAYDKF